MEDFVFDEGSSLIKKIVLFIIVVVISMVIILFFDYKQKYTLHLKDKVVYELGSKISEDITKYITNEIKDAKDYTLVLNDVPLENGRLSKVGTFKYQIKYKKITKTGKISVYDTVKPIVETKDMVVGVNEEIILDDFLVSCEDYSKPCKVDFENSKDESIISIAGKYDINIVVSDQYNNKVIKKVNLEVKKGFSYEKVRRNDLSISYTDPNYDDFNKTLMLKFSEALDEEELEKNDKYLSLQDLLSDDLSSYLPSEYVGNTIVDQEVISAYNKYNYIVGFAIRVKLSSGIYLYLSK